jgi:cytochrome P450
MTDSAVSSASSVSSAPEDSYVFNPFAEGFVENPYPAYAELRETAPVHHHPLGFWILAEHEDVAALLRSPNSVDDKKAAPGPLREMAEAAYGDTPPVTTARSMLDLDPPDHTRLRRLVSKAFTPRSVEALEPRVVELVDEALDRIAAAEHPDLVSELAFPLPFAVISEMLGMPEVDTVRLRELTGVLVRSLEPVNDPELMNAIAEADREVTALARDLIEQKRRNPADDLFTALINAEEGGDVLSDDELVAQVMLLYVAGHETTVNLIAGGSLALLRNPDQYALLRENPELVPNAVEEFLRYDSPVQMSRRITLEPYQVREHEIPAGSFVLASLASANRDPKFWGEDAGELRVDRPNARQHTSFGAGVHHCLGAALARLEARVAFDRLVRRFPAPALESVAWNGRINLRGPETLVVTAS